MSKTKDLHNPVEGKKVVFVENAGEPINADGVRGHLEIIGETSPKKNFYITIIKRLLDIMFSLIAIIVLSPVYLAIIIAIVVDDPGPAFFVQKRVGYNKKYFYLHKFRSMKMSTPHDVPTHMLEGSSNCITRVGRILRQSSLDELPQFWDILIGNMSLIGPRPALWNQDLLVAERDKYGANDIKPGLSGWAQVNGRDSLLIPDKAKYDGEYVEKQSFLFDIKCLIRTVKNVVERVGVCEGKQD